MNLPWCVFIFITDAVNVFDFYDRDGPDFKFVVGLYVTVTETSVVGTYYKDFTINIC